MTRADIAMPKPLTAGVIGAALRRQQPVSVPAMRVLRRSWSRALRDRPGSEVAALADALLAEPGPWSRLVGYELLANHPTALKALTYPAIARLARGLDDWGGVDTFACYVAGPAWREGILATKHVHRWLRSRDRWQRRLAVVCTVPLNLRARGGRGDVSRTLAICRKVVGDRDDMVVKALSWALRTLVAWDRAAVQAFLEKHGERLATRVRREVTSKLRTGLKTPHRRKRT